MNTLIKPTYTQLEEQLKFWQGRADAAESKLSLISRGFKVEEVMSASEPK